MKPSSPLDETVVASATRGHDADREKCDLSSVLKELVCRYQLRKRPVTVNFRRIVPTLNSVDRFAHLLHPYPAKLLVHIPFFFLANELLSKPGDIVLDPFCGSGTVLAEAQLAGRRAYGVDANPLARLIARVKTTPLDTRAAARALDNVLRRTRPSRRGLGPDVVNLGHWFYPSTVRKLQCLLESIQRIRQPAIRNFLLVCFSVCVRKVSLADPRLSVPVKLKFGQYPQGHPFRAKTDAHLRRLRRVNLYKIFDRVARANVARMERVRLHSDAIGKVELLCSDARCLIHEFSMNGQRGMPVARESVKLIITSPPYPGAQKYIRACSLSLGWLGLCPTGDLRAYKALIIGREEFAKAECLRRIPTNIARADRLLAKIRKRNPTRAVIAPRANRCQRR